MSIVRWSPFREVEALNSEMNRLFSRLSGTAVSGMGGFNSAESNSSISSHNDNQWLLPMDVVETQNSIKLRTALPGVNPDDINIEINDNQLMLSAKRYDEEGLENGGYRWIEQQYGTFTRSVTLPKYVNTENIEATFNNGLLELVVPKKASAKPRRVELKTIGDRMMGSGTEKPKSIAENANSSVNSFQGVKTGDQEKEVQNLAESSTMTAN